MTFKITVLCENTVMERGLLGEHGLSVLLEIKDKRFLLDTGSGMTLLHNARRLEVDLKGLDGVILSHGHFDHTGGLKGLLQAVGPLTVYAHPDVFSARYKVTPGNRSQFIGMPVSRAELEDLGASFQLSSRPVELMKGLTLSGEIPREDPGEGYEKSFYRQEREHLVHDDIPDDMAVILDMPGGVVLVLGCAHAGTINTLKYVLQTKKDCSIRAVIGGMHLFRSQETAVKQTVTALAKAGVEYIFPCHCTGNRAELAFLQSFGEHFKKLTVGTVLELEK